MRGALIVGIDKYPEKYKLEGCVNDARKLNELLSNNGDDTINFDVELKEDVEKMTKLREMIIKFFSSDLETGLFYFSGHGFINSRGGVILTPDFRSFDEGVSMDEILVIANQSKIRNKIIIIDACNSGSMGDLMIVGGNTALIAEGVAILLASRKTEEAKLIRGSHSVFSGLLIKALQGGAADIAGDITLNSIYNYIDKLLGFWKQRPLFKANLTRSVVLRKITPVISIRILRNIVNYFQHSEDIYYLDPSFEPTNHAERLTGKIEPYANEENCEIFRQFSLYQGAGLLIPQDASSLYFAAMESKSCVLTLLGQYYWELVKNKRI
jgi:Caspase domain